MEDLLKPPEQWSNQFDFVLESYMLQVLPPELRAEAMRRVANFVAPNGRLLVIARGREPHEPNGEMPWPLLRVELATLKDMGPNEIDFEVFFEKETPPVRRFRATCQHDKLTPLGV